MTAITDPVLSVVVAIVSDTIGDACNSSHLRGCLESLRRQAMPPSLEIIVPYHARVMDIEDLKRGYPEVTFVPVEDPAAFSGVGGAHERYDRLRACGLAHARGQIIGLLEDHARAHPDWCRRMTQAHEQDYAAIGGVIETDINRPLNWAVCLSDFSRYQRPLQEGPSQYVSDANVTFKRSALDAIRPVWIDEFRELEVTAALLKGGGTIGLFPDITVYQHREGLVLGDALRERVVWGRAYGASRGGMVGRVKRAGYALMAPAIPIVVFTHKVLGGRHRRHPKHYALQTLPLIALLTVFWSIGEFSGYVTGTQS